jgi:hypothetical protein
MTEWVMPEPLAKPAPRKVRMSGGYLGLFVGFATSLGLLLLLCLILIAVSANNVAVLARRGGVITGTVTSFQRLASKQGELYRVGYRFEPPELTHAFVKSESGDFEVGASGAQAFRVGESVSLIYDPLKPDRAMLPAELKARIRNGNGPLVWLSLGFLGLPILIWGMLLVVFYQRQKRLLRWGKCAPAKIVDERHYETRGGPIAKVTYAFKDDKGATVTGKFDGLPVHNDPLGISDDRRARHLANPIAVYDPRNSRRNTLYPGTIARLV